MALSDTHISFGSKISHSLTFSVCELFITCKYICEFLFIIFTILLFKSTNNVSSCEKSEIFVLTPSLTASIWLS